MNSVTVSTYPARVTLRCGQNKVTLRYAQKGERGIGISNVALDDKAHLIVTYDDGKIQDAGAIPLNAQKGERGIGISNVALDDKAHLIVTYDDGKIQDAGAIPLIDLTDTEF